MTDKQALRIQSIVQPIVRRACRANDLNQEQPDVAQEVIVKLLGRLPQKRETEITDNYLRRSARLDAWKLCRTIQQRQARERRLEDFPHL